MCEAILEWKCTEIEYIGCLQLLVRKWNMETRFSNQTINNQISAKNILSIWLVSRVLLFFFLLPNQDSFILSSFFDLFQTTSVRYSIVTVGETGNKTLPLYFTGMLISEIYNRFSYQNNNAQNNLSQIHESY